MNKKPTYFQRLPRAWHAIALSLMLILYNSEYALAAPNNTLPQQLIDVTQSFLEQIVADYLQRSAIQGRYEIQVKRIDPRLRLMPCENLLKAALETPARPIGRVTVRIQCEGAHPWTVFMPAQVHLYREVIVATHSLQRQTLISATDITLAERDIGLLSQGYLTDVEQAIGNKLGRPLIPGQIVAPAFLQQPATIHKGDQVIITAAGAGISVRMIGEALSDGSIDQQIRVKNLKSERIIKARVIGPGQVEVNM